MSPAVTKVERFPPPVRIAAVRLANSSSRLLRLPVRGAPRVWGFALLKGLVGGVPPAIRAARAQIAVELREL